METRQDEFAVSGAPTLVVQNINGDVEVSGSAESGKVLVTSKLRRPERLEYLATQEGNTVQVTVKKRRAGESWWSRLWGRSGASDIVVAVPRTSNVDIRSSNGDITAHRVAGEIILRTSNGDVEAGDGDGAYDLHSSNGDITVAAGQGEFNLHTSNGDIRFAPGILLKGTENRLRTSNGNIDRAKLTGEIAKRPRRCGVNQQRQCRSLERNVAVTQNSRAENRLEGPIGDGDGGIDAEDIQRNLERLSRERLNARVFE